MISVTKCGYDSHHPIACDIEHADGLPNYLLLLVKTDAWFVLGGRHVFVKPNTAILFDKNTYIHYGCHHPDYNDDWIHFRFSENEDSSLLNTLGILFGQPLPVTDMQRLSRYVQLLTREFHFRTSHSDDTINHLMHALLYALADDLAQPEAIGSTHRQYPAFLRLRTSIYNNPALPYSSERLADSLQLSVSRFQHLYKAFFSVTAQNDIIHARIAMSKFYLQNSNMSIRALAAFCGYENEVHFMRQFKKQEEMTPSEFRKIRNLEQKPSPSSKNTEVFLT